MTPMHRPPQPVLVAGLLLVAAHATPVAASGLEDQDWQLARYRTEAGLTDAAEGGARAVLRFEDGRVGGSAGCNRLLGGYSLEDEVLTIAPNMASTMMACPPPLMEQEQAVIAALGQVAGYGLTDTGLALTDADGEALLTFVELAGTPLTGTTWHLTHYNNGKGGLVTVAAGTDFVLMLADDGRLSGKACNNYRGGYIVSGEDFALEGPLAATKMLCPEPEGINEQEAAYFAALERVASHRIRGDELVLLDADGATQARFRAAQPGEQPSD
ncbi:META domain-containing protein [uncultured Thiohalocapsa sp.]|uniref:META domain-containing protein n=1 Tax=uncultured Thiohalocapsa sp. TaxID=768990 RepID=UPI0025CF7F2D|nr:META domain-containing protein [uncultured Thiohalocapsa sp.]